MKFLLLPIFLLTSLCADVLLSPYDALKLHFNENVNIEKKSILISKQQAAAVQKRAQVKLSTKIYKTFKVTQDEKLLGYGVLVIQKVRTKNSAVLSVITPEGTLKAISIIAFNEPPEYLPTKLWVEKFNDQHLDEALKLGKNIPNITGATFSARSATDASRVALALYELVIKER